MKLPLASLLLSLAIVGLYFHLSGGLLYLDQNTLDGLALGHEQSPFGFASYMFVHVGVIHLAGNLLPLVIFAVLLELSVSSIEVLVIFLGAGLFSSVLFYLLNPTIALVGASAGVSGLIGAAVSTRPKLALPALILSPLVFSLFVLPAVQNASFQQQNDFFNEANQLNNQFEQMLAENRTEEAAATNERLSTVVRQRETLQEGVQREEATPSDFLVHLFGVVFGVAYVFHFRRGLFEYGAKEFISFLRKLLPSTRQRPPPRSRRAPSRSGK